jgi:hypothetical protein
LQAGPRPLPAIDHHPDLDDLEGADRRCAAKPGHPAEHDGLAVADFFLAPGEARGDQGTLEGTVHGEEDGILDQR